VASYDGRLIFGLSHDEVFVVCIDETHSHLPDSLLVKCSKCPQKVWMSPHHFGEKNRKPLCMACIPKGADWGIDYRDVQRAKDEIRRKYG